MMIPGVVLAAAVQTAVIGSFAGTWSETEREFDGQKTPVANDWPSFTALQGTSYAFEVGTLASSWSERGTFAVVGFCDGAMLVDVTATLKHSTDFGRSPDKTIVRQELWRVVDDKTFQRCLPLTPEKPDRPKAFKTAASDGVVVFTYERKK